MWNGYAFKGDTVAPQIKMKQQDQHLKVKVVEAYYGNNFLNGKQLFFLGWQS